ncbi:MAG: disulfide bond formation protein B [Micavibrio sp.]|nr:disulfide bond formation protein B [Micavibrio sp.]
MSISKLTPCHTLVFLLVISLTALAAAFASEAFLGLEPCILCIYQRWPYAAVVAISGVALLAKRFKKAAIGLSGLAMAINSGIALYHSGIERKWWDSGVAGCKVPADFTGGTQSILENIMSAPTGNCSEIPWQDPLIGLSMANYNVIVCFGLFALCVYSFVASGNAKKA